MRAVKQNKWLVVPLAVALSTAVACGGDDDDDDDSSPAGGSGGASAGGMAGASAGGAGGMDAMGGMGGDAGSGPGTVVDVAVGDNNFSSLVAALTKAELVDTLSGAGPFTVFAPTNAAFDAFLTSLNVTLDDLTKDDLIPILTYHVVAGKVEASDVVELSVAETVNGSDFRISVDGSDVTLKAGNGDIEVTMVDIPASNGVIHVVDTVMVPPKDIPGVAADVDDLSILVQALQRADLVMALEADGPFTVFAPTNAAFTALLDSNNAWTELADIPLQTLKDVLQYHVVSSKAYSEDVVKLTTVSTLLQKDITIDASNGVKLNTDTSVAIVDVLASNGVVHVIDKVLLPPQ